MTSVNAVDIQARTQRYTKHASGSKLSVMNGVCKKYSQCVCMRGAPCTVVEARI